MRLIIAILLCLASNFAFATLLVSVDQEISAPVLKNLVHAVVTAKARPKAEMAQVAIYPIFDGNENRTPYTVRCLAFLPDQFGEGCTVFVPAVKSSGLGSGTIRIEKNISVNALNIAESKITQLLSSINPNDVEGFDHKQIGAAFTTAKNGGAHVYCVSEGVRPQKKWRCIVAVSESIN